MSSNIKVQRICQYCGKEFTARTTVTKYCSNKCSKAAYKARKRAEKVKQSNAETIRVKIQPIEQLKVKEFLNINEVCELIGVSRRTVYRLIKLDKLKIVKIGSRTIVKRSALDELLNKPYTTLKPKPLKPITEFYTVEEIKRKFNISTSWVFKVINENNIPKMRFGKKIRVSKKHIDRYFKKNRDDISKITEWYTVNEAMKKYNLSRDAVYSRVSENAIPKQKIGKYVKFSKIHFDELFILRQ